MRYVAVPYEALELIPRKHWHAVTDLYKRAHTLRYKPFKVTEKSLATAWGISPRQVRGILQEMEALDLLVIIPGGRGVATRVRVADPVAAPVASSAQAKPDEQRDESGSGAVGVAVGEAGGVDILGDHDPNPDPTGGYVRWCEVRDLWQKHAPNDRTHQWVRSKGNGKLLQRLEKKDHGDLELMLRYLRESDDTALGRPPKGRWCFAIETVARKSNLDRYIENAKAWAETAGPSSYLADTQEQRAFDHVPTDDELEATRQDVDLF